MEIRMGMILVIAPPRPPLGQRPLDLNARPIRREVGGRNGSRALRAIIAWNPGIQQFIYTSTSRGH